MPQASPEWLHHPHADAGPLVIPMPIAYPHPSITSVNVMPASALGGTTAALVDVAFRTSPSPVTSPAVWTAGEARIAIGHVPSPLPDPFVYPTFDAFGGVVDPGDFTDVRLVYNSNTRGPFTWSLGVDTWNPLGLDLEFAWDGIHDVALMMTSRSVSAQLGGGGFPAFSADPIAGPQQRWTVGYQAPASLIGGAGAHIAFLSSTPTERPALSFTQSDRTSGAFQITGAPVGSRWYAAFSIESQGAGAGSGWFGGAGGGIHLHPEYLALQLQSGDPPFTGVIDGNGEGAWSTGPWSIAPYLHGRPLHAVALFVDPFSSTQLIWSSPMEYLML